MYFNFTRSYVLVYYSKNDFVHNLMSIALLLIIQKPIKKKKKKIRCLHEDGDRIVSVSSSKVSTFSIVFVSSSKVCGYGSSSCKQEAYPERFLSG